VIAAGKVAGMRGARTGTIALACLLFMGLAQPAGAELTERGDLFIRFDGGLIPDALPRHVDAPISVWVKGTVRVLSGSRHPPSLRQISIALNRGGHLETDGLPTCNRSQIDPATSAQALAACGPALVGTGRFVGKAALPGQEAFSVYGKILAFNAVVNGRTAIFAHVYTGQPVPSSRIIVFQIHHRPGTFGTVLTGDLPVALNHYGYVKQISLRLHRLYSVKGQQRSYLNASCPAPAGFPGAVFPFARASMVFDDGRRLSSTLRRSCHVLPGEL
jgi:hypothetical protein